MLPDLPATDLIRSGLDAREANFTAGLVDPSDPIVAPVPPAHVPSEQANAILLQRVEKASARYAAKLGTVVAAVEKRTKDRVAELVKIKRDRKDAEKIAEQEATDFRLIALNESEADRLADLREAHDVRDLADKALTAYLSSGPVPYLSRIVLEDSKVGNYMRLLEHAGPATLRGHFQTAIDTKNRALAFAIMSRMDAMTPDHRKLAITAGVDKDALAEAVVGAELRTRRKELLKVVATADAVIWGERAASQKIVGTDYATAMIAQGIKERLA